MRKIILSTLCGCLLMCALPLPALAVDSYNFATLNTEEFYTSQDVHSSVFGTNVIAPELDEGYGLGSQKPSNAPGQRDVASNNTILSISTDAGTSVSSSNPATYPEFTVQTTSQYNLTSIESIRNTDGSIGTLKIPKIGLNLTAYDGDTFEAMAKGVGHISSTSCWNGTVGLVAHNRGVNSNFGRLSELKAGDEITYTTSLGTRTYIVTTVQKISSTNWSLLQYTSDNRITLITCINDQPNYRLAVQGVEKT